MVPVDEAVNRAAPEPPLDEVRQVEAVIQPKTPSAQVMKTAWSTEIAPRNNLVVEAQRLAQQARLQAGPGGRHHRPPHARGDPRIRKTDRIARDRAAQRRPCSPKWLSPRYNKHVSSAISDVRPRLAREARIDCAGLLLLYHHQWSRSAKHVRKAGRRFCGKDHAQQIDEPRSIPSERIRLRCPGKEPRGCCPSGVAPAGYRMSILCRSICPSPKPP